MTGRRDAERAADRRSWLAFEAELLRYDPLEWVVLSGDRRLVSLLGLVPLATTFALVVPSGLAPLRKETPVLFLLFALIGANFTLIAIVTSLSQFVLGRRLESPGDIRGKMRETIAYREDVGETIGRSLVPVKPDAFFLVLYRGVREELDEIETVSAEGRTRRAREGLDALVSGLRTHVDYVIDLLERPESGLKHALFTSLNADYEHAVHRAWYLRTEHANEFTARVGDPLDRLTETLKHLEVASRMFRTVFIESEVAELSRYLLYVGLPVQLAAVVVMLLYTAPGSAPPLPMGALCVLVPAVLTAGFAPFLVLASYVVRLTVVARRTADTFPFSSQLRSTVGLDEGPPDQR
ncbi:MAG: hypothetical protein V5A62_01725 [Haloarculaceae archaeon]